MNEKPKMTRQGLRDLNYYGPKRPAASPATDAPKALADATGVPAALQAPAAAAVGQLETAAVSKS